MTMSDDVAMYEMRCDFAVGWLIVRVNSRFLAVNNVMEGMYCVEEYVVPGQRRVSIWQPVLDQRQQPIPQDLNLLNIEVVIPASRSKSEESLHAIHIEWDVKKGLPTWWAWQWDEERGRWGGQMRVDPALCNVTPSWHYVHKVDQANLYFDGGYTTTEDED